MYSFVVVSTLYKVLRMQRMEFKRAVSLNKEPYSLLLSKHHTLYSIIYRLSPVTWASIQVKISFSIAFSGLQILFYHAVMKTSARRRICHFSQDDVMIQNPSAVASAHLFVGVCLCIDVRVAPSRCNKVKPVSLTVAYSTSRYDSNRGKCAAARSFEC